MKFILFVLAIISAVSGFLMLAEARSAIHEIEAFVVFLMAACLFGFAVLADVGGSILGQLKVIEGRLPSEKEHSGQVVSVKKD